MNIVLLGAPGSGKGTQGKKISQEFNIPHISIGEMLREGIALGEPTALASKEYMERGELVPDEIVLHLLNKRLESDDCKKGYILDGFPRTPKQAKNWDKPVDAVIDIMTTMEEAENRVAFRGGNRFDQGIEAVAQRSSDYEKFGPRVAMHYQNKGNYLAVNGNKSPWEVYAHIRLFLEIVTI